MSSSPSVVVMLISSTVACMGFARLLNIKGVQVIYSGVGAFLALAIQLFLLRAMGSNFTSTLIASMFIQAYAEWMARLHRAPATIFLISSIMALIPGYRLYMMMYGAARGNAKLAADNAIICLATVLAIALGFIAMGIVNRYVRYVIQYVKWVRHRHVRQQRAKRIRIIRSRREPNRYDWDVDTGTGIREDDQDDDRETNPDVE